MTQIEIAERNKQIVHLSKTGKYTAVMIARTFGMKKSRVLQILRSYNVQAAKESHKLHSDKAQEVIKMLEEGIMQSDISRKLNVSRQYVSQIKFKLENLKEQQN